MYGLLIESLLESIHLKYGVDTLEKIRQLTCPATSFCLRATFSESIIPNIAKKAGEITGVRDEQVMEENGCHFVDYLCRHGYDKILRSQGRHLRDFLNSLDNLHEYLRFSYPNLVAPSFYVTEEDETGLTLAYRSRRRGFVHYVIGQLKEVSRRFYDVDIGVDIVQSLPEEMLDGKTKTDILFRLQFNNAAFCSEEIFRLGPTTSTSFMDEDKTISVQLFFDLFPFSLIFREDLQIMRVGKGLARIKPDLLGSKLDDRFSIFRPMIDFDWKNIISHPNSVYELVSCEDSVSEKTDYKKHLERRESENLNSVKARFSTLLHLKGQMINVKSWNSVLFLCSPIVSNLTALSSMGLFLHDLPLHDSSRELVLLGSQQSAELKLALAKEKERCVELETAMGRLDVMMKRTDELMYQMIPRQVAERLKAGEEPINTCQYFPAVSILFSDIVGFTSICSKITPMQVVTMLNRMYTTFDDLIEQHDTYKVETIGDAYMVVSGLPTPNPHHATAVADFAVGMIDVADKIKNPVDGSTLGIRVGIHSGPVVAGVVGVKVPRYTVFGDAVNTASRMESNGAPMKIHISKDTKDLIDDLPFVTEERGTVAVKGKGEMKTYWLLGRKSPK